MNDCLGGLCFVFGSKGVVPMRIDYCRARGGGDSIIFCNPGHSFGKIPSITDVKRDAKVDVRDFAQDVRIPAVHSLGRIGRFITDLKADTAKYIACGDF